MKLTAQQIDSAFMRKCLILAQRGAGFVSPNPMVGAVIVQGSRVIGCGYHRRFGGPHAEVNAVRAARGAVRGATLYVNLEPCNFFGKTPPCTELIIRSGFARVVVGGLDPNPRVSGKGVRELRRAGIRVDVGILREECEKLNESFAKYVTTGLPFVTLKIAQTLDGKIADTSGRSRWISGRASRQLVHILRSRTDAVLIGAGTVAADDPSLTVRLVHGRNPLRVILDGRLRSNPDAKVFSTRAASTLLFVGDGALRRHPQKARALSRGGVELIARKTGKDGRLSLREVLRELGAGGIASVMVEGGASVFGEFLKDRLVDKLLIFQAPRVLGAGVDAFGDFAAGALGDALRVSRVTARNVGDDVLIEAYLEK